MKKLILLFFALSFSLFAQAPVGSGIQQPSAGGSGNVSAFILANTAANYMPPVQSAVLPPGGFVWQNQPAVIFAGVGGVGTTFDVATLSTTPTATYYVNVASGSDGNNCTSAVTACQSITHAYSLASGNSTVHVAAGWYNHAYGPNNGNFGPSKNVNLICDSPLACIISSDIPAQTFSSVGNHYEATQASTVNQVIDASMTDTNGYYSQLTQVASSSVVDSTAGTWFWAAGTLYVHLSNGRAPDSNVHVYKTNQYAVWGNYDVTYYIQGFLIVGGDLPVYVGCTISCTSAATTLIMKNDTVALSAYTSNQNIGPNGNTSGPTYVYLQNVISTESSQDAISYANLSSTSWTTGVFGVEINTQGLNSVWPTAVSSQTPTQNGSTSHGLCAIVRIGGYYGNTYGPTIADVGNAQSWIVGSTIAASQAVTYPNVAVTAGALYGTFTWLYDVNMVSVANGSNLYSAANGTGIYLENISGVTTTIPSNVFSYTNPLEPIASPVPGQGFGLTGSVTVSGLASPANLTVQALGTGGSTTYAYSVAACAQDGTCGVPSTVSYSGGNATLSAGNCNELGWTYSAIPAYYKIWRTTGSTTQGYIANAYSGALNDCAFPGDSASAPTVATAGDITAPVVQVGSTSGPTWTTGAAVPTANCAVGSIYSNTAASSASTALYVCYPANTWTAVTVP